MNGCNHDVRTDRTGISLVMRLNRGCSNLFPLLGSTAKAATGYKIGEESEKRVKKNLDRKRMMEAFLIFFLF